MTLSFIMQSYLGDYPGSRSNPVEKFHRMVNCILSQTNSNWELIIVADGCDITLQEYEKNYKSHAKIKFAYVSKPKHTLMYAHQNGQKYFRGVPRQVGLELATGDWISYIDSDDYILNNAVENILNQIKIKTAPGYPGPPVKALLNRASIKNEIWEQMTFDLAKQGMSDLPVGESFKLKGLDSNWKIFQFECGKVNLATVSVIHKKDWPNYKWVDSIGNVSEDMKFIEPLTLKPLAENSDYMSLPYYVICHYSKKWDY